MIKNNIGAYNIEVNLSFIKDFHFDGFTTAAKIFKNKQEDCVDLKNLKEDMKYFDKTSQEYDLVPLYRILSSFVKEGRNTLPIQYFAEEKENEKYIREIFRLIDRNIIDGIETDRYYSLMDPSDKDMRISDDMLCLLREWFK